MSRIKISMPETILFSTQINVRITDINYGNHLGNDSVLSIAHEARVQFLKSLDYSELDIESAGIIMNDAAIVYKAEARYGDKLQIDIAVDDFSRKGCDFFYHIKNDKQQTVAIVKTGIIFFDYEKRKPVRIPAEFLVKTKSSNA